MALPRDEKLAIKAACIQAAAILLAGLSQDPEPSLGAVAEPAAADTGNCARYARDLFGKLTNEPWE